MFTWSICIITYIDIDPFLWRKTCENASFFFFAIFLLKISACLPKQSLMIRPYPLSFFFIIPHLYTAKKENLLFLDLFPNHTSMQFLIRMPFLFRSHPISQKIQHGTIMKTTELDQSKSWSTNKLFQWLKLFGCTSFPWKILKFDWGNYIFYFVIQNIK